MRRSIPVILVVVTAFACGGKSNTKTAAAPTSPKERSGDVAESRNDDGVVRPITQGQLDVAHYATGDGTIGLVLDRTSARPKIRVDGEKDITELTMVEDRTPHERRGWFLKSPNGYNVLYLSTGGGLKLFRGRDHFYLNSDKSAQKLPAATVVGEYKPPKSHWDKHVEALTPLAVRTRFTQFKPEDSGNLTKVAEAMGLVTTDMLMHVASRGSEVARYQPASSRVGTTTYAGGFGLAPLADTWDKAKVQAKGGLAKYGGRLEDGGIAYGRPSRPRMFAYKGWPTPLAIGTPGILWEMSGGTAVFVTLDGGRYQIDVGNDDTLVLEAGAGGSSSSWPAPLAHALIDVETVRTLAKGHAISESTEKEIDQLDDGWFDCVNRIWKTTKDELDKLEAGASLSANDKWGRMSGTRKAAEMSVPKKCAPEMARLEQRLVTLIEARNTERMAIYEKAKGRFK